MLLNGKPVPNGLELFAVDEPNNEDVAKAEVVFANKDGVLLAGNAETPVCPNIAVLVEDVNGLELAADVVLNEVLNSDVLVVKPVEEGLEANGFDTEGFGFGVIWLGLNGFGCGN